MKNLKKLLIFFFVFFFTAVQAQEYMVQNSAQSKLGFEFDSTLHYVHGHVNKFSGIANYDTDMNLPSKPAEIIFNVADMKTEDTKRDEAMYKMFDYKNYPAIKWTINDWSCKAIAQGSQNCIGSGILKIRNIEKPYKVPMKFTQKGSYLNVVGDLIVTLADFDLKPPSVLGLIKVSKVVTIKFDTLWNPVK